MSKNKFYYIFCNDKYVDTIVGIPGLAKFLHKTIRSIKVNMTRNKKRKYCILKNDKGIEYRIENEKQFFGSRNVK